MRARAPLLHASSINYTNKIKNRNFWGLKLIRNKGNHRLIYF